MNPADGPLRMLLEVEQWPLRTAFRITGSTMVNLDVLVVTLETGNSRGRGEATGVDYLSDDIARMQAQLEALRPLVEAGIDRATLQNVLPPGGARNALDCALWELESLTTQRPVWEIAGLNQPRPLLTTYTIGADEPAVMAAGAAGVREASAIKVKLTGESSDGERVRAVRSARPDVWLGVDANQGFTVEHLRALLPSLIGARVKLIEQPFRVGCEPTLDELLCPIPLAADESVQSLKDIPSIRGRFQIVNVKLDKCGGLTEALAMAREASRLGLGVMVGNMVGTSLAMAPAYVIGQLCQVVDLDGPTLLRNDRSPAVIYKDGHISCDARVWGA